MDSPLTDAIRDAVKAALDEHVPPEYIRDTVEAMIDEWEWGWAP